MVAEMVPTAPTSAGDLEVEKDKERVGVPVGEMVGAPGVEVPPKGREGVAVAAALSAPPVPPAAGEAVGGAEGVEADEGVPPPPPLAGEPEVEGDEEGERTVESVGEGESVGWLAVGVPERVVDALKEGEAVVEWEGDTVEVIEGEGEGVGMGALRVGVGAGEGEVEVDPVFVAVRHRVGVEEGERVEEEDRLPVGVAVPVVERVKGVEVGQGVMDPPPGVAEVQSDG